MKGRTTEYRLLHLWVEKTLGKPSECWNCKTTKPVKYEWANVSGKYLKEPGDWKRLCVPCHRRFDNQLDKEYCIHGHKYTDENTYRSPSGQKECRTCRAQRRYNYKPKELRS